MIRLDKTGRDVTGCPYGESPDDVVFHCDDWLAKYFAMFFWPMPAEERKVAFDAVHRGWTIFPVGGQMVYPSNASDAIWDIAIAGEPFQGKFGKDKVKWDVFSSSDLVIDGCIIDSFQYWQWRQVRFYKLLPDVFEAFVCGTRLCLEHPSKAKTRAARYAVTSAWYQTTDSWGRWVPF
jgi:hypothetical protein